MAIFRTCFSIYARMGGSHSSLVGWDGMEWIGLDWMDGWMDWMEWMDWIGWNGWKDGWMDGWMEWIEWMEGWKERKKESRKRGREGWIDG